MIYNRRFSFQDLVDRNSPFALVIFAAILAAIFAAISSAILRRFQISRVNYWQFRGGLNRQ